MATQKKYFINDVKTNQEETELEIKYQSGPFASFYDYSGGVKQRILLELCIKIATFYAKFKPTILIIENSNFGTVDDAGLNALLKIIKNEEPDFQFFFTSFIKPGKLITDGYSVWELKVNTSGDSINAIRL